MHKGSAPTSGCLYPLSAPLLWSHPPLALLRFCLPLSLSRLRLDARSSAEIHPLSLKFSASWLFRSDKNRGLIRAEIKADWRHSCILPLLHLATLTIPSSFLRPVVWSWMFNRKQSFEGALFAARTHANPYFFRRTPADLVSPWFRSRGRLFYVPVCVSVCCDGGSLTRPLLSLLPSLNHDTTIIPRMPLLPGSLEVCWVCFHTQGAGGGETKLRLWVWGCVFVHSVFVCAGKGELGEGKKNLPDLLTEQYFQKYTYRKKKEKKITRGKNNKPKKTEKQPTGIYPLSAATKAAAASLCGKQTRERIRHKLLCCQPLYRIRWLKWH